jgi:hypothetical protein
LCLQVNDRIKMGQRSILPPIYLKGELEKFIDRKGRKSLLPRLDARAVPGLRL